MKKRIISGYIITCGMEAMQLGEDGDLYLAFDSPITVFAKKSDAINAKFRSIRRRIKRGFNDKFADSQCYSIHRLSEVRQ